MPAPMAPADPHAIDDETLQSEFSTVLTALHVFAHRTGAPAGTDVIEWARTAHQEVVARQLRTRRSAEHGGVA